MLTINLYTFWLLLIAFFITIVLFALVLKKIEKSQMRTVFLCTMSCQLIMLLGLILQILLSEKFNIDPIYFEYFVYIGNSLLPVSFFFMGLIFIKTKIDFRKSYLLLFIIPIISILLLWTNNFHHLFYKVYSINLYETVYGPYMTIHSIYSYVLLFCAIIFLMKYSIKNAGFFSRQSIFITIGCAVPLVINILSYIGIIASSVYLTSISFTVTILLFALAIFRFNFLKVTPIALQRIVDRISDSYIVLNEKNVITDFNKSFLTTFKFNEQDIRNKSIFDLNKSINLQKLENALQSSSINSNTVSFEVHFDNINKYFNIEVSSLVNNNIFLGTLILFKDITQHEEDLKTIKDNQDMLVERERFASLRSNDWWYCSQLKNSNNVYFWCR